MYIVHNNGRSPNQCVHVCVTYSDIDYSVFFLRIFIFNSKTGTIKMISYYPVPYTLLSVISRPRLRFKFYFLLLPLHTTLSLETGRPARVVKRVVVSLASFSFCPRLFIFFVFFYDCRKFSCGQRTLHLATHTVIHEKSTYI